MTIDNFLLVLKKVGYPNPNLLSIAEFSDYNLDNFLPDLDKKLGREKLVDFCKKALSKISGPEGMKVDFGQDEYVVVNFYNIDYDPSETESDVVVSMEIDESKILTADEDGNEVYKTLREIEDDISIGDWADYDEMMDFIKSQIFDFVNYKCGFGIYLQ